MQNVAKMSFTIEHALKNELDEFSKELSLSKSRIIANALELYFDTLDLKIAQDRLKNPQIISQDEMQKFVDEWEILKNPPKPPNKIITRTIINKKF